MPMPVPTEEPSRKVKPATHPPKERDALLTINAPRPVVTPSMSSRNSWVTNGRTKKPVSRQLTAEPRKNSQDPNSRSRLSVPPRLLLPPPPPLSPLPSSNEQPDSIVS